MIAAGDRGVQERIAFRPSLLIGALELDLLLDLLGRQIVAPILVVPTSPKDETHAPRERGTATGLAQVKVTAVYSSTLRDSAEGHSIPRPGS